MRRSTVSSLVAVLAGTLLVPCLALAAEQPLPFEGTWVRSDRVCTATAPSARTYAGRTLITPSGRCSIRKVAFGAGEYEIFEDCHRAERPGNVVEKIKMQGPDAMVLKYQTNRLKIPRGRHYLRCTIAAPKPLVSPPPGPGRAFAPPPVARPPVVAPPSGHDPE